MKTYTRSDVTYWEGKAAALFCRQASDLLAPHPHTYSAWASPVRKEFFTNYEQTIAVDESRGGRRGRWKSFESHKAFRSDTAPSGMCPAFIRAWELEPHRYEGWLNGMRFGLFGYDPLGNPVYPHGEPGLPLKGLPAFRVLRDSDGGLVPPPLELPNLVARSIKTMLPSIKAEISSVNSLVELPEVVSLIPTLGNIVGLIKGLPKKLILDRDVQAKFGWSYLKKRRTTLKDLVRGGTDVHLQFAFNIRPLLSDIAAVQTALSQYQRRVNDLISRQGYVRTRHFAESLREGVPYVDAPVTYYYWRPGTEIPAAFIQYTSVTASRQVVNEPSYFHAELLYNYNFTAYQAANAQLLGFLDILGVNLNPSIIWNAIPYTFIIDWVFGVSRFLEQFSVANMEPQVNILNYLWSVKRMRRVYQNVKFVHDFPNAPAPMTMQLPSTTEVAYRRTVGIPEGFISSVEQSGLTLRELTLGASLVTATKLKSRRPAWQRTRSS